MRPRICLSRVERFFLALEQAMPPSYDKNKNCTKGYACGDSCISRTRKCRKQANGTPKQEYVEAIGKKKKRTTKKSEKPEPEKTEKQEKPELDKTLGIPDISPVAQSGIDFLGVEFAHRIEQVMQADAELDGLKARFEQAKDLLDKARSDGADEATISEYAQNMRNEWRAYYSKVEQHDAEKQRIMEEVRDKLKTDHASPPISLDKAVERLDKKMGIQDAIDEFFSITGGYGQSVELVVKRGDRASYSHELNFVNIGSPFDRNDCKRVIFHEFGHAIEYERRGEYGDFCLDFIKKRATGRPEKLSKLTGFSDYDDDEVAYPDKFIDEYVGKVYPTKATEVLSTGLEHFVSAAKMVELYKADKEHFYLTIGAIRPKRTKSSSI